MDTLLAAFAPLFGIASSEVASVVAVFARISGLAFLIPGIGEQTVSMRVRLAVAIAMTLVVYPAVRPVSSPSWSTAELFGVYGREAIIGLAIGISFRLMIFTLQLAGSMIAQNTSIAQLFGQSVASDTQTPISALLTLAGITIALSLGVHVDAVRTIIGSYDMLALGHGLPVKAFGIWLSESGGDVFRVALSLSAPFIALGMAYNLIIGAANRAMPQLMVAFVGAPAITGAGILLLALSIGFILERWRAATIDFSSFFGY
ncbi:MAG: type III secretion protein [Alphaproteobacteria bacterium]|nr:type III secretion protein [Alphaproteobacteria bacterium]